MAGAAAGPKRFGLFGAGEELDQALGGADEMIAIEGICTNRDDGREVSGPLGSLEAAVRSSGHDVNASHVEGIDPAFVHGGIAGAGGSSKAALHDVVAAIGGLPG